MDHVHSLSSLEEDGRRELKRLSLEEPPTQVYSVSSSSSSIENSSNKRTKKTSYSHHRQHAQAAEKAARYYGECYMEGVGSKDANTAAQTVGQNYRKWWLQQFGNENANANQLSYSSDKVDYREASLPELTSPLVEEDLMTHSKEGGGTTDSSSYNAKITSKRKDLEWGQPNSLPNGYFYSSDQNLTHIGGTANAVALSITNGEGTKSNNTSRDGTLPPVEYISMQNNEKKRYRRDLYQNINISPDKFNVEDRNDDKSNTKQTKLYHDDLYDVNQIGHGRDVNYLKASSFDNYMSKVKDYVPRVTNGFSNDSLGTSSVDVAPKQAFQYHPFDEKLNAILTSKSSIHERRARHTENAKLSLVHALAVSGGDITSKEFLFALDQLMSLFLGSELDARKTHMSANRSIEGTWLCLSSPHFKECLGENSAGEYMYTMGRMSFDMFAPTNLVCSIQCVFNTIERIDLKDVSKVLSIPRHLQDEVHSGKSTLRTYNIVTAFTIEPDSPTFDDNAPNKHVGKALQGLFTVQGYILPDPEVPNRLSIWFSGGEIVANENNERDLEEWKKIFEGGSWKRHLYEKARLLAARLLLGAEIPEGIDADGSMRFKLNRPIGGHGSAYVDVLYLDETLRVVRGHHGTLFVFTRVK